MDARMLTAQIHDFEMRYSVRLTDGHAGGSVQAGTLALQEVQGRKRDKDDPFGLLQMVGSTAVISIKGPLMKSQPGTIAEFCPSATTVDMQNQIQRAVASDQVDQILLWIDSPGGSVDGSIELADAVYEARQQKPVTAQVDGLAASAGYWIASQASEIVAGRSDLIGSIGVFSVLYDMSRMAENDGIKVIPVQSGKFKTTGLPGTKISDEQIADEQRVVNAYFSDFKAAIQRGRGDRMTSEQIDQVADGRVFKADSEALGFGLIDRVGYLRQTLRNVQQNTSRKRRAMQARVAALGYRK
jgi:signal peptide peptidase SppA